MGVSARQAAALCLGAAVLGSGVTGMWMHARGTASGEAAGYAVVQASAVAADTSGTDYATVQTSTVSTDYTVLQADTSATSCPVVQTTTSASTAVGGMDVSGIAAAALPSVVSITSSSVQEVRQFYDRFGRNGQGPGGTLQETTSCGSGVIIARTDQELYMVTNYHVVEDATALSVTFVDGTVCTAQLCGTDSDLDLAVIKVSLSDLSADTLSQISVAAIGDSNSLRVGEQVVAIGNALGYGQSVTTGIVSALNRAITSGTDSSGNAVTSTYIQTDAAINPGNSGGALLNMSGQLIGINTAKTASTEVEGMGYAIPISNVWGTIQTLMTQTPSSTVAVAQSGTAYPSILEWWGIR